jgi:hypothetical protein
MFAKLLLKVAKIIKREKGKSTIIANPSIIEPTCVQIEPNTIAPPIAGQISVTTQCKTCTGCGFVKTDSIICDICNGRKCMNCNSLGLTQLPWSECPTCYGSGEIRRSM